jgi:hypothetical protein
MLDRRDSKKHGTSFRSYLKARKDRKIINMIELDQCNICGVQMSWCCGLEFGCDRRVTALHNLQMQGIGEVLSNDIYLSH